LNNQTLNITLKKAMPITEGLAPTTISLEKNIFYGEVGNPLLAPRGVFVLGDKLIVADTGQNRVFIWNTLPTEPFQNADVVLGQLNTTDTGRNSGDAVNASSLMYPSGIWTDGEKLVVADAWNHRVLIWNKFPTKHGQAANVVIGQKDFQSNEPNIIGIGNVPNAHSLNWPYGVYSDGTKLFVADTGNRRVLIFNKFPTQNFAAADTVIGKPNFEERDYEHTDAIWPYSIKLNKRQEVAITDTQYYRVLLWNTLEEAIASVSKTIIGQPDIESSGQNQFNLYPKENTLSWCYDSCFYKDGLLVADTGNSRVLWFEKIPSECSASAQSLIGKKDFNTGSENAESIFGTEKSMYWPFSISVDENAELLAIADTGNHRILIHKLII
jgi:hypothetical protein